MNQGDLASRVLLKKMEGRASNCNGPICGQNKKIPMAWEGKGFTLNL